MAHRSKPRSSIRMLILQMTLFFNLAVRSEPTAGPVPTTSEAFGVASSLVIPCHYKDARMLQLLLESLSKQTVMPDETILVLSQDEQNVNGTTIMEFNFPHHDINSTIDEHLVSMPGSSIGGDDGDGPSTHRESSLDGKSKTRLLQDLPLEAADDMPVRARGQPLESSVHKIPNLKVIIRTGTFFAGHNRIFGVEKSRNETDLFFFFDCDDYMHHRRTEYIAKTFNEHPELDAMIHSYKMLYFSDWDSTDTFQNFLHDVTYVSNSTDPFPWTYEEIRQHVPFEKFANEPLGEPLEQIQSLWYFPYSMDLPDRGQGIVHAANGWVTFRRAVLDKVEYPVERYFGEDSIFNYRMLRAGLNWNYLPLDLGLYIQPVHRATF